MPIQAHIMSMSQTPRQPLRGNQPPRPCHCEEPRDEAIARLSSSKAQGSGQACFDPSTGLRAQRGPFDVTQDRPASTGLSTGFDVTQDRLRNLKKRERLWKRSW